MKDYIEHILPFRKSFKIINLYRKDIHYLETVVIKHLNLRDLNELRDKFEGQAFLNNYLDKTLPIIALQKYLKTNFIDLEKNLLRQVKCEISINNIIIKIIKSENNLPLIDLSDDYPIIIFNSTQNQIMELCGFASLEVIKNNLKDIKSYGFGSKEKMKGSFYGFDQLKMFDNIDDLAKLIG